MKNKDIKFENKDQYNTYFSLLRDLHSEVCNLKLQGINFKKNAIFISKSYCGFCGIHYEKKFQDLKVISKMFNKNNYFSFVKKTSGNLNIYVYYGKLSLFKKLWLKYF